MIILSIVIFIIILALLIMVHEWGHFTAARKFGIRVDEFGFGFPPKIKGFKKGDVEYSINWIPLGGFVRIFGESREGVGEPDSFVSKPIPKRMIVILAGVFMNWVLAATLLTFGFWYGLPQEVNETNIVRARDIQVVITKISADSPAEKAGLKIGDAITKMKIGGEEFAISEIKDVQKITSAHKGEEIDIEIKKGKEVSDIRLIPRVDTPESEGPIGVALGKVGIVSSIWYKAPLDGVKATAFLTIAFVSAFYGIIADLVTTGKVALDVAGPIGIGRLTYQFTQLGFSYLIQFAAILSINLAILNALPIPALDGGRFVFLAIEAVKGSPVSEKVERAFQSVGFALLILLMVAVTLKDIIKLF